VVELILVAVREATVVAGNGVVFRRFATALGYPRIDGNAAVRVAPRTIANWRWLVAIAEPAMTNSVTIEKTIPGKRMPGSHANINDHRTPPS